MCILRGMCISREGGGQGPEGVSASGLVLDLSGVDRRALERGISVPPSVWQVSVFTCARSFVCAFTHVYVHVDMYAHLRMCACA